MSCYFYFVYRLLDLSYGECDVISMHCMCFFVNGSVCLVCCVFVICMVKQFAICLGVGGSALLDRPCMVFQRMCLLYL